MAARDPFSTSLMSRPPQGRLAVIGGVVVFLWLAVAWAVVLP